MSDECNFDSRVNRHPMDGLRTIDAKDKEIAQLKQALNLIRNYPYAGRKTVGNMREIAHETLQRINELKGQNDE